MRDDLGKLECNPLYSSTSLISSYNNGDENKAKMDCYMEFVKELLPEPQKRAHEMELEKLWIALQRTMKPNLVLTNKKGKVNGVFLFCYCSCNDEVVNFPLGQVARLNGFSPMFAIKGL